MTALVENRGSFACKVTGLAAAILLHGGILLSMAAFETPATGSFDSGDGGLTIVIGEAGGAAEVDAVLSAAETEGTPDGEATEVSPETMLPVTEMPPVQDTVEPVTPVENVVEAVEAAEAPVEIPMEPVTEPVDMVEEVEPLDVVPETVQTVEVETVEVETVEPEPVKPPEPVTAEVIPETQIAPPPVPQVRPVQKKVVQPKPVTPPPAQTVAQAQPAPVQEAKPERMAEVSDQESSLQQKHGTGAVNSAATSRTRSENGGTFAASSGGGGASGARKSYFASVQSWLERHKRYPRAARLRRYEGVVEFRFTIDRSGNILDRSIVKSSGRRVLDEALLKLLKRANPVPPVPQDISEATIDFTTSIAYTLQ